MTDKITLTQLSSLENETTAINQINGNSVTIVAGFDNTLSRDGTSPNQMGASLDMNSFQILNLPSPGTINSPARLVDVTLNPTITVPPTGTSGTVVPFLSGNNTWSGTNTFSNTSVFNGTASVNTKSLGDNSNNIADTAFVNTELRSLYAYGVKPDGTTDNTTALNAAITAANNAGGNMTFLVPEGITKFTSALNPITVGGVYFKGTGGPAASLLFHTADKAIQWGTLSTALDGGGLIDVGVQGPGTNSFTSIYLPNVFNMVFNNVKTFNGVATLLTIGDLSTSAELIYVTNVHGTCANVACPFINVIKGSGLFVDQCSMFPSSQGVGGRSFLNASTGSWDTVSIRNSTLQIFDSAINIACPASTVIQNYMISDSFIDTCNNGIVVTSTGSGSLIEGISISDCNLNTIVGHGISFGTSSSGTIYLVRIVNNNIIRTGISGINLNGGSIINYQILGNKITGQNYVPSSGGNGIDMSGASSSSYGEIIGNDIGWDPTPLLGAAYQPVVGLYLGAAQDHLIVANNSSKGTTSNYDGFTTGTTHTSAHTNASIVNNIGFTGVASTLSPGSSPWTFTNGAQRTTLYLSASTSITALTQGGNSIIPAATGANVNFTVPAEPNEVYIVTYTGTLTAKQTAH